MSAVTLEWSYNPWRDRPARAWLTLTAAIGLCWLVTGLNLPALANLVLCVAVVTSFAVGFLPVRCRVDGDGVQRRSAGLSERRKWDEVRRAVRTPEGVWLSRSRERSWLDAYRNLFLPLPPRAEPPLADDVDRILSSHGL